MRINDVELDNKDWLKTTDLENLFSVVADKHAKLVYNLNKGLYLYLRPNMLSDFILTHDMHWPLISYKIYGTTRLAWLLYKLNKVTAKTIFDIKYAGDTIKYLSKDYLATIVDSINDY